MSGSVLECPYHVRGYDCGYGGPLRPFSLGNFFQEAAGDSAGTLGIGMEQMFAQGLTWMLSKIDIRIEGLPQTGDDVTLRTWPNGTDRIYAMRCIEMIDAQGKKLAGASYAYLVVDIKSRKLVRPERIMTEAMKTDRPLPFPDLEPGLHGVAGFDVSSLGSFSDSFLVMAAPRHIDNNGHVNNAFELNWLCDAVPLEERGAGNLKRIKIEFNSEIKRGELLKVKWKRREGTRDFLSVIERDGQILCRGLTRWE